MTAQVYEILILEGERLAMTKILPLPESSQIIAQDSKLSVAEGRLNLYESSMCWRHYQGTWEIKENRLFLNKLTGRFRLADETPIFADWVSDQLILPYGALLEYVHMGFGSKYEFEKHLVIENGVLTSTRVIQNTPPKQKTGLGKWFGVSRG